jgi:hypothetical protein
MVEDKFNWKIKKEDWWNINDEIILQPISIIKPQQTKKNFKPLKRKIVGCIRECLKSNITTDEFKTFVGCDIDFFIQHIESQFEPWMNWENRSKFGCKVIPNQTWDIDHIIPLCTAKIKNDVIRLNHYTNLRPLCAYENRFVKKGFV